METTTFDNKRAKCVHHFLKACHQLKDQRVLMQIYGSYTPQSSFWTSSKFPAQVLFFWSIDEAAFTCFFEYVMQSKILRNWNNINNGANPHEFQKWRVSGVPLIEQRVNEVVLKVVDHSGYTEYIRIKLYRDALEFGALTLQQCKTFSTDNTIHGYNVEAPPLYKTYRPKEIVVIENGVMSLESARNNFASANTVSAASYGYSGLHVQPPQESSSAVAQQTSRPPAYTWGQNTQQPVDTREQEFSQGSQPAPAYRSLAHQIMAKKEFHPMARKRNL